MKSTLTAIIMLLVLTIPALSQECRRIEPIGTPSVPSVPVEPGGTVLDKPISIDRGAVEQAMQAVAQSWNSPGMSSIFTESFYNKDRLMDVMAGNAHVDATMRLISVGSYRVLNQVIQPESEGNMLVSRVSVSARVQVEYNDPVTGFQRRPGEQEYIIKITQKLENP